MYTDKRIHDLCASLLTCGTAKTPKVVEPRNETDPWKGNYITISAPFRSCRRQLRGGSLDPINLCRASGTGPQTLLSTDRLQPFDVRVHNAPSLVPVQTITKTSDSAGKPQHGMKAISRFLPKYDKVSTTASAAQFRRRRFRNRFWDWTNERENIMINVERVLKQVVRIELRTTGKS